MALFASRDILKGEEISYGVVHVVIVPVQALSRRPFLFFFFAREAFLEGGWRDAKSLAKGRRL
jgi:hypothetical protein